MNLLYLIKYQFVNSTPNFIYLKTYILKMTSEILFGNLYFKLYKQALNDVEEQFKIYDEIRENNNYYLMLTILV